MWRMSEVKEEEEVTTSDAEAYFNWITDADKWYHECNRLEKVVRSTQELLTHALISRALVLGRQSILHRTLREKNTAAAAAASTFSETKSKRARDHRDAVEAVSFDARPIAKKLKDAPAAPAKSLLRQRYLPSLLRLPS
jgi:hypothetical protein